MELHASKNKNKLINCKKSRPGNKLEEQKLKSVYVYGPCPAACVWTLCCQSGPNKASSFEHFGIILRIFSDFSLSLSVPLFVIWMQALEASVVHIFSPWSFD